MMNEKHPIDDLFQRGLHQHTVPPPMHIWERIEESRGSSHRSKLVFLRQKLTIVSSAAAVLLVGIWLNWPATPNLGSFPIVTPRAMASTPDEDLPVTRLTAPLQEAGLLPSVRKLPDIPTAAALENTAVLPDVSRHTVAETTSTPEPVPSIESITLANPVPPTVDEDISTIVKGVENHMRIAPMATGVVKALPTALGTLDAAPLPVPETGCARFSEGRPAIFLALTAGPSLGERTFSAKDEEYESYAGQRSNSELARLYYTAGARLSVVFPWGGAIRSGVDFTQLNEQLVYNSRVRQTIITQIFGPNGEVVGADTIHATDTAILKYNNRYRLIDIPLQLGYEVRYNKVTVAANIGASLNVAFSQKGNYLGPQDLLPTRFDSDDPATMTIYKNRIGLGLHASLGLHYQLNDRLDLMAEPYLRYYSQSFTRDDYPLNQKYLVGGIGLGLRVLL